MPERTYREKKRSRNKKRQPPSIFNLIVSFLSASIGIIALIYAFTTPINVCFGFIFGLGIALIAAGLFFGISGFKKTKGQ